MHAPARPKLTFLLVALSAAAIPARAQVAAEANAGYQTEADRARLARNLDRQSRVAEQKPAELVAALEIQPGQTVADVGSGPGFMTPYFVDAVGPNGQVIAEDIQQQFLDEVEGKVRDNGWKNVKTVLGTERDPNLPAASADLIFILDAYHHFNYPSDSLAKLRSALRPGGRLVVVDFYRSRKHPRMSKERLEGHIRLDRDGFRREIEQAGFQFARTFDHLPYQYVLIFERGS